MLISSRQSGFSLIELMIAVVIIGIVAASALPNYRSWMQNSQIRTAAESLQNGLQLARAEAARRNSQVAFSLTGNDWSVDMVAIGAASGVFYTPVANVQSKKGTEGTKNAVISATSSGAALVNPVITFNGAGRVVTPANMVTFAVTNPTGGACATTTNLNGSRCLNLTLDTGGKVRMCDPALTGSGNPQGC